MKQKYYYPELEIKSKAFNSTEEAIKFYKETYGEELVAICCDEDPTVFVVFEKA